jgi:dipeptidyl aminopeptidase/acylaminoacyl peptidase
LHDAILGGYVKLRLPAALAALCLCGAAAAADTIPAIDFFKHPLYRSVKISPDGKYLAATVPEENRTRLAIIKLADMSISAVFNVPDGIRANRFFWVNNERVVFDTVEQTFDLGSKLERPRQTGMIYTGKFDGSDGRELHGTLERGEATGGIRGDSRPYYLEGRIPNSGDSVLIGIYDQYDETVGSIEYIRESIYQLNVDTAHRKQVAVPPYRSFSFLSDADGQVRYTVAWNEHDEVITSYRASNDAAWTVLSTEPAHGERSSPLGFSADGSHAYLGAPDGVYLVDLKSGQRKLVSKTGGVGSDDVVTGPDMQTPIGVAFENDYPGIELFEPGSAEAQTIQTLQKTFKDQRVQVTSYSRDGKAGVVRVSGDTDPGEFFLFNLGKKEVVPLLKSMPWIDPAKMATMDAVQIKARDGTVLHGYLTTPRGAPDKGLPLVVLVHGGPRLRDEWGFDPEVQFLASRGYAVLQVNYRGSGGYGHDFEAMGYRQWGGTMQDDVTDATLWAIKDGVADARRICIAGASYGAYSALMGVIREPDLYRCAFAYDGVYDLELMFSRGDTSESMEYVNDLRVILGTDAADLRRRSPVYNVERIKVPLLLAHGMADERAPYAHFTALTAALDKAGKHYESLVKPKEEHGFYNEKNATELYEKLAAFLDRNIGKGAAPAAAPVEAAGAAAAAPAGH